MAKNFNVTCKIQYRTGKSTNKNVCFDDWVEKNATYGFDLEDNELNNLQKTFIEICEFIEKDLKSQKSKFKSLRFTSEMKINGDKYCGRHSNFYPQYEYLKKGAKDVIFFGKEG